MSQPHIILPDSGAELLRRELALAFSACGCRVSHIHPDSLATGRGEATEILGAHGPALFFSVNFHGLYPLRERLELLAGAGVRAAVWFVDNPWNILSGVRDPRWKSLPLFVTDASFVGPLRAHGAQRVWHLPLAASFELFSPNPLRDAAFAPPKEAAPLCFVGRSAFPGKEIFFRGLELPATLVRAIPDMLAKGQRPDLSWWEKHLGLDQSAFWPGKKARLAALGAEESNLAWRALCLAEAARAAGALAELVGAQRGLPPAARGAAPGPRQGPRAPAPPLCTQNLSREQQNYGCSGPPPSSGELWSGKSPPNSHTGNCRDRAAALDIYGDEGWRALLPPGARLKAPVDYYSRLPGIYASARYSLCLTSLQLPAGLNQRHFDVWAAGGFAVCDATPGLDIFPGDLVRPLVFRRAADLPQVLENLEKNGARAALQKEWRNCLLEAHTYTHRAQSVLEALEGSQP